jgi:hypothetical protein
MLDVMPLHPALSCAGDLWMEGSAGTKSTWGSRTEQQDWARGASGPMKRTSVISAPSAVVAQLDSSSSSWQNGMLLRSQLASAGYDHDCKVCKVCKYRQCKICKV